MAVEAPNRPRGRGRGRPGVSVGVNVLLVLVVIVAAGLVGSAHLTGARWWFHKSKPGHARPQPQHQKAAELNPPAIPAVHHAGGLPLWVLVVICLAVVLALGWLLSRWLRGRHRHVAPGLRVAPVQAAQTLAEPEPEAEPELLLTGIAAALRAIDEARDPTDAIVRAWLGLEATAEESGVRRGTSETPTEFTGRVMQRAFADDQAIATLLRLYLRTRFGDHPPTAADVTAVRDALARLVENWRATPVPAMLGPSR